MKLGDVINQTPTNDPDRDILSRLAQYGCPAEITTIVACLLPFLAAVLLIRPFADVFYIGDEWAYAQSVLDLISGKELGVSKWSAASAITQMLYGIAVVKLFGFSISSLNISVLVLSAMGLVAGYAICRTLSLDRSASAAFLIFLGLTPLYLGIAPTFMTDMPHTTLAIIAVLFFVRGFQRDSLTSIFFGGFAAYLAYLNRQVGVVLLVAFAVTVIATRIRQRDKRRSIATLLVGFAAPLLLFSLLAFWFPRDPTPFQSDIFSGEALLAMAKRLFSRMFLFRSYQVWAHIYILFSPLLLLMILDNRTRAMAMLLRHKWLAASVAAASVTVPITVYLAGDRALVPVTVLYFPLDAEAAWWVISVVASPLSAFLFCLIWDHLRRMPGLSTSWFFITASLGLYILATTLFMFFGDRYFLPFFPLAALIIVGSARDYKFTPIKLTIVAAATVLISAVILEQQVRWTETAWATADRYAQVYDSESVYGPFAWYGWRHHDKVMSALMVEMKAGVPMRVYRQAPRRYMQQRARLVIRPSIIQVPDPEFGFDILRCVEVITYRTLVGERELFVMQRSALGADVRESPTGTPIPAR